MRCTSESHETLKADPVASALPYRGMQETYDDDGTVLELRNCRCNSTLCKPVAREVSP